MKVYGSLNNRIDEGKQYCQVIEVGTGMTEYLWSDRHAYEVVKVESQEHVWVRRYDARTTECYSNHWILTSNPENPVIEIVKRNNGWNKLYIYNKDEMMKVATERVDNNKSVANNSLSREERINVEYRFMLLHAGLTENQRERLEMGKSIKKYEKWNNISFGVADEHYDYEF